MVYHVPVILTHTHIFKNTHTHQKFYGQESYFYFSGKGERHFVLTSEREREVTVSLDVKPDAGDVSAADKPVKGSH